VVKRGKAQQSGIFLEERKKGKIFPVIVQFQAVPKYS
jgi:hypothetical protein